MNNLPIKFLSVTIQNFRGIPDELVVPLDAPLTVIHAANGTGKSTICYALEWLLTGKVDDLNSAPLNCQWGEGKTSVSAQCLIDGKPHVLTRSSSSLWLAEQGAKKTKINDERLLEMLTPASISGRSTIASKKAKRGWLRNSRWLYSNSLSLLIDNNKADERQQIFADILGFGHLTSTLRDLRDYRKALPNTKGVADSFARVSAEIEVMESELARSSPLKEKAEGHLATLFKAMPPVVDGSLSDRLSAAQVCVAMFGQKHQRETNVLRTVYEQWSQYHESVSQVQTLRASVAVATAEQKKASDDHVTGSSELSDAQVKVSEGERAIKWADDSLSVLYRWLPTTANPGVVEFFQDGDVSQSELRSKFVELTWPSSQREEWRDALDVLSKNVPNILELERQKQELLANPVAPALELDAAARLADEAKSTRVRAEADFNAFSNVLEKLKVMGTQIVHSHDDAHCPLCNHNWGSSERLRTEISSGQKILAPALETAGNALADARQKESEAVTKLALINGQKQAYDAYHVRLSSVNQALKSFATSTKYLETMQVQDFSALNPDGLAHLTSRVTCAIQFVTVFEKLVELEAFFGITPNDGVGSRVSTAIARFASYKKHFQDQTNLHSPVKTRLTPVVQALADTVRAKSGQIASINVSIAAAQKVAAGFDTLWKEIFQDQPVSIESYELMRQQLDQRGVDFESYRVMLSECEAVVSSDTVSLKLKKLQEERAMLASKLKTGTDYVAAADLAIENYAAHVKDFTASSLKPLLSPAAELFSRMHANEVYKGLGVSDGGDALKWTVFAEGHEPALDAEGKLSQGQRQDLALSLYLARARNTGGSFFLDEPIAHLDDLNRVAMLDIFRLVATSMPSMSLVLTTASDALARHMAQKFSSITDKHLLNMIHLEGNPRTGVKMTVQRNAAVPTQSADLGVSPPEA
jgi:exonuclease SbcC